MSRRGYRGRSSRAGRPRPGRASSSRAPWRARTACQSVGQTERAVRVNTSWKCEGKGEKGKRTNGKDLWHRLARALALVVPLRVERVAQPQGVVLARHVLAPVIGYRRELGPAEGRVGLAGLSDGKSGREVRASATPWFWRLFNSTATTSRAADGGSSKRERTAF